MRTTHLRIPKDAEVVEEVQDDEEAVYHCVWKTTAYLMITGSDFASFMRFFAFPVLSGGQQINLVFLYMQLICMI
ncbi:hypothetical protein IV203_003151 [Nitzschia inconspicua]|uniref:Uncharacterized protein n=1 Tax=Nitzschia inconspicua TaxID=303405 RepID=A0A9K3L303_9STRA|nr:hypothetical protein IV203_003151 [Nitzschia inconspicua]